MGIELSASDRWKLLENNMVMRLATADPHGYPHVTPIWYYADQSLGRVFFSTPEDTRKVRDIEHFPKASLTVDVGEYYFDLKAVIVEGTVSEVENTATRGHIETEWCEKYFDQSNRPEFMELLYQDRSWEWYEVEPSRWISWDNDTIDLDQLKGA